MVDPATWILVAVSAGRTRSRSGTPRRARIRSGRALTSARHRRVLRRVGRYARHYARDRGAAAPRRWTLRDDQASTSPSPTGDPARAVAARADSRSATCSTPPRSSTATTRSRPATTSTTEAAVLPRNVLRWETGYLGRQYPVLRRARASPLMLAVGAPGRARDGCVTALLRGIDYRSRSARWRRGNRHLGFKEAPERARRRSPGAKAAFLFGFFARVTIHFGARRRTSELAPCPSCGAPTTTGGRCAFCSLRERAASEVAVELGAAVAPCPDRRRGGPRPAHPTPSSAAT